MGNDLDGNSYEGAGASVDINSDGTRIIVGAPQDTTNNYSGAGYVRVYELDTPGSSAMSWWGYLSIFSASLVVLRGLFFFWRKQNRAGMEPKRDMNKAVVQFPITTTDLDNAKEINSSSSEGE